MKLITKFLILCGLLFAFLYYVKDNNYITVTGDNIYKTIAIFMGVLVLLNLVLKPILSLLTIPLNCLTMGLFSFVINFGLVYLADYLVPEVAFKDMIVMFVFSLAFSFLYSILDGVTDMIFD